jgi:hypothetical protein
MARELFPDRNVVEVYDTASDTEMEFYYRSPTDAERLKWANAAERRGKKIVITDKTYRKQAELAAQVLTGFREGDHKARGVVISSDKDSPNFHPTWKKDFLVSMPEVLRAVGQKIFAGVSSTKAGDEQLEVTIEDFDDPDLGFTLDADDADAAGPTPAAAPGAPEAAPAENP